MDFRHLIVTCLFSKLRLPFDNQKVKENYAILSINIFESGIMKILKITENELSWFDGEDIMNYTRKK